MIDSDDSACVLHLDTAKQEKFSILKVPKVLAESWSQMTSGCVVGTFVPGANSNSVCLVSFIQSSKKIRKDNTEQSPQQLVKYELDAPQDPDKNFGGYYSFSRKQRALNERTGIRFLGKIKQTFLAKPVIDASYRSHLQSILKRTLQRGNRTTKLGTSLDNPAQEATSDHSAYLFKYYVPFKDEVDDEENGPPRHTQALRGVRLTEEQAKAGIFNVFEGRENEGVRFKEIQMRLNYPATALKLLLQEVAEFKSIGSERPLWHLKPEYRVQRSLS